jgi:hypothetical protein
MKKLYTLFALICFTTNAIVAQDIQYNFSSNGNAEGWEAAGSATLTVASGDLTISAIGNFGGARSSDGLNLAESSYTTVEIIMENTTDFATFQVLNYLTGSTSAGTATKQDFTAPAMSATNTYTVNIPTGPNSGTIDRIGIRAKGQPTTGTLRIESITIVEFVSSGGTSYNGFVENAGFEDTTSSVVPWTLTGDGSLATATFTNDATEGVQAARIDFGNSVPGGQALLWNNYAFPISPAVVYNETVTVSWDMKATSTADITVAPRWKMAIVGGGTRTTFAANNIATAAYASYSVSRDVSNFAAETYSNIELGLNIFGGENGASVLIDNIVTIITGTSLGVDDVTFLDDKNIRLFPNPVSDILTIDSASNIASIKAINFLGQVVVIQNGVSNKLNVSTLPSGTYVLKIVNENGSVSTKKFIKAN